MKKSFNKKIPSYLKYEGIKINNFTDAVYA